MTADSLLPCAWCGGTNLKTFRGHDGDVGVVEYVQCMDCTSCGPDHKNGRHWNQRNFRPDMAQWLRARAETQEQINAECPAHSAAYQTWRDAPIQLRMYAAEVEAGR